MATKKTKHYDLIKLLCVLGGVVGILMAALSLASISTYSPVSSILGGIIDAILGIIFSALTILMAIRPDDPIPLHWLVIFIFAVLLIVFSAFWGGIILIIAGLISLIDAL